MFVNRLIRRGILHKPSHRLLEPLLVQLEYVVALKYPVLLRDRLLLLHICRPILHILLLAWLESWKRLFEHEVGEVVNEQELEVYLLQEEALC